MHMEQDGRAQTLPIARDGNNNALRSPEQLSAHNPTRTTTNHNHLHGALQVST
jgi:hypothetical protein